MVPNDVTAKFTGGRRYLNTTNYGLWPKQSVESMQAASHGSGAGTFDTATRDMALEQARGSFAAMVEADAGSIAIGGTASTFVGLVAAAVPDGSTVLLVEDDFTSLTLPFVVHAQRITLKRVRLDEFLDAIDQSVDYAVVSAAQSGDGSVIDLAALAAKRRENGVKVLLDVTQSAGWLPVDAGQFDVVVAAAYKWLLCPRGVAFAYFSAEMTSHIPPLFAGWFAAENTNTGYYGTDVALASNARRFDTSPSGINWLGAAPALQLLSDIGVESVGAHNVALANDFRKRVGLPLSNSAIVSLPVTADVLAKLANLDIRFGIQEGKRSGNARFAFHLYNTPDDVIEAAECFQ